MPTSHPDNTQDYPTTGEPADRAAWLVDALAAPTVSYTDQLACARVQLRLAQRVYAVETQRGTATAAWATHQCACQQAIIATLERLVAVYEPPAQETRPL